MLPSRARPLGVLRKSGVRHASRLRQPTRSSRPPHDIGSHNARPAVPPKNPGQTAKPPSQSPATTSLSSISETLRSADPSTNTLLAPVHIPSSPASVLRDDHPSTSILANSGLVVHRQIEMMNVFMGFEQANRYVILDAQGNHIGYMAEHDGGLGSVMKRQLMRTHRGFVAHVFDKGGREVLRFNRPFSWINSRIGVYDPVDRSASASSHAKTSSTAVIPGLDPMNSHISPLPLSEMRIIGEAQQEWAPLRRKYNLFLFHDTPEDQPTISQSPVEMQNLSSSQQLQISRGSQGGQYTQFARVDEPFLSWDFSLLDANKQLIGSVNRNFVGFAREIFTDTGVYALRMDSAGLTEEARNKHLVSQSGRNNEIVQKSPAMSLDQRAVMLATAVSIDFDYFSRHSGAGGFIPMPLWIPWFGGEAAGAGVAGTEAAGVGAAGAAEGTGAVIGGEAAGAGAVGTLGRAAGGASGAGEGAMAGAGTMAGYEMLQRGRDGNAREVPPQDAPPSDSGNWWEQDQDPNGPSNQGGQGGNDGGGVGGDGGGGDGGGDWSDWF